MYLESIVVHGVVLYTPFVKYEHRFHGSEHHDATSGEYSIEIIAAKIDLFCIQVTIYCCCTSCSAVIILLKLTVTQTGYFLRITSRTVHLFQRHAQLLISFHFLYTDLIKLNCGRQVS